MFQLPWTEALAAEEKAVAAMLAEAEARVAAVAAVAEAAPLPPAQRARCKHSKMQEPPSLQLPQLAALVLLPRLVERCWLERQLQRGWNDAVCASLALSKANLQGQPAKPAS